MKPPDIHWGRTACSSAAETARQSCGGGRVCVCVCVGLCVCVCACVCVCVYLMLRPCMMAKGPVEPRASWEVRQFLKSAHCTSESSLSAIRFLRGNTQCVIVCVCVWSQSTVLGLLS